MNQQLPIQEVQDFIPQGTKIDLPDKFDPSTGAPVSFYLPKAMTKEQVQEFADSNYPRTILDAAIQIQTPGAAPVSEDEFNKVKEVDALKFIDGGREKSKLTLSQIGKQAIAGLLEGALEVGKTAYAMFPDNNIDYKPHVQMAKVVEAFARGSKNLYDSGILLLMDALKKTGVASEYEAYNALKVIEKGQIDLASNPLLPWTPNTKDVIESSDKMSNVLDATILMPPLKAATGVEGSILRGAMQAGLKTAAAAAEAPAKASTAAMKILKAAASKTGPIGAGLATAAGTMLVGGDAETAAATGAAVGLGPSFARFARFGANVLGEEAFSKIVADSLRQGVGPLGETTLKAMAAVVPDSAVRMTRKVIDGVSDGAILGAAIGQARAASDPSNTGWDVANATIQDAVAGGAAGGFAAGVLSRFHELSGKAQKEAYVKEIARDLVSRPEMASANLGGVEFVVPDEKLNRVKVAEAADMTEFDKMRMFGILDSAERAGSNVVFVNDTTKLPDSLGGSGAGMGAGVHVVTESGKQTIFINSDRITAPTAIEEVVHGTISDSHAGDALREMIQSSGGIDKAIDQIRPFAESYISETRANDPTRADSLSKSLSDSLDESLPYEERISKILPIAHEYIAKGIAEKLKTATPEQLMAGRGGNIASVLDKALGDIFTSIQSPASGASFDVITGHFYKDGKLVVDPIISKMADNVLANLKTQEGLKSPMIPGDIGGDGTKVVKGSGVTAMEARPRYEDLDYGGTPTSARAKELTNNNLFNQLSDIFGNSQPNKSLFEAGGYFGNISPDSPIIYTTRATPSQLARLFEVKTSRIDPEWKRLSKQKLEIPFYEHDYLIDPKDRPAVERLFQAMSDGHLVTITGDVSTSKTTGSDRQYTVRGSKVILPISFQVTPNGGPVFGHLNFSLLHDVTNHQRSLMKSVDKALTEFGIKKTEDWIPVVNEYLKNFSSGSPNPGADAIAGVAPKGASVESARIIRDLIHLSSNTTRVSEGGAAAFEAQLANKPGFALAVQKPELVQAVNVLGASVGKVRIKRDRNAFPSMRADSIRDVALFQPDGLPIKVEYNPEKAFPHIRANFSPGKNLRREKIGSSEVLVDDVSGQRIVSSPKGATLFSEGKIVGKFDSAKEAIDASNKQAKSNLPRAQRTFFTDKEKEKLRSQLLYGDIKGSKAEQELRAVQKAIREANRSPEDIPAWVEEREFLSETERRVQTEARKRRKQRQEIARQAEEFWSGNVKAEAEPMAESVPQKQKRVAASPELLESLASAEVPNKPKLKITEITPTPKKQKAVKSFADLEVGGLKEFAEPTAKAEPKPKPQVTDLLGQQSYRYTVGMQKADAKVAQAKSDFLVKLAGWEADAKKRLSELEPNVKKKIEDVRETAAKVEEIPVDMEPEPPKSGSSEMPETQIPNVATAADDARVPRDFAIKKSASRKFSVYTIGSSAVQAVADSYREALLLAHKKRNEKLKRK